jgi:cell division protein FtsW (lipid II flippase)
VAATTQLALPSRTASPIALWHLLSLDAPTVAALWTWFIARASHVRLPLATPAATAFAVWILYATDRILDAANAVSDNELEARHRFHHRHCRAFLVGIALAAAVLVALLPQLDPAAIHLYLPEGALLFAWFLVVHSTGGEHRLPKEIAVGLFFSAAVFIPTVAREPAAREPALRPALLPSAVLFAALCSLNCLFIYAWEHRPSSRPAHTTTRFALAHLPALAIAIALAGAALVFLTPSLPKTIPAACALAAVLLLLLDRNRQRLTRTHLRAAADLALLTPVLLLSFLR